MSILIALIFWLVIIGLVVWALGMLPFEGQFVRIIQALTVIAGVLWLVERFGFR